MLKSLFVIFFIFSFLLAGCSSHSTEFHDNLGNTIQFSDLKDNWIIINYWASWCNSCKQEIPELNKFYKTNKNKNIKLFGVNYDGLTGRKLKKEISRFKIQYPVLLKNPDKLLSLGNIAVLPATFIINPKGKITKKLLGPQTAKTLKNIISSGKRDSQGARRQKLHNRINYNAK